MYGKIDLDDLESREVEGIEPTLRAVGYRLRPEEMRPSVWEFEEAETNRWHRHGDQEELYVVLDGEFLLTVERDGDRETVELGTDAFAVVPPETWRQVEALTPGRLLVVGAPNVKDDAITEAE